MGEGEGCTVMLREFFDGIMELPSEKCITIDMKKSSKVEPLLILTFLYFSDSEATVSSDSMIFKQLFKITIQYMNSPSIHCCIIKKSREKSELVGALLLNSSSCQ